MATTVTAAAALAATAQAPARNGKVLNLAIIGVGLVGAELLNQLANLPSHLASQFRLAFVSNSKHSVSSLTASKGSEELNFTNWKEQLAQSTALPALEHLPRILGEFVAVDKNPFAVVDNTSSQIVALLYPKFLRAGIHIVTPNKKAFSSEQWLYDDILTSSKATGAKFYNESTVGAGLPIISTLKDLVNTGDEVWILTSR